MTKGLLVSALLSEVGRGEVRVWEKLPPVPLTPQDVSARIISARAEMKPKPWSRLDLATAMDRSPSAIYRWEKKMLLPSVNELIRLAEVLGKPPDYFTEPPERQVALADFHDLLAEARVEAERGRTALRESLVSIDDRLSAIEAQLAALADLGTSHP